MSANFETEGASPTNRCWRQKTGVIALSCGVKISTVHCLVLSQSTNLSDTNTRIIIHCDKKKIIIIIILPTTVGVRKLLD